MILDDLFKKYNSDKSSLHHNYSPTYEKYLFSRVNQPFTLLELGYGGYEYIDRGGGSLLAWQQYFPYAQIVCLEKYKKLPLGNRIRIYEGEQTDEELVKGITERHAPEIVIDDCSHLNPLTIRSFEIIFPLLAKGTIYFVEDCHTSYWKDVASDGTDFGGGIHDRTVVNYFKHLVDVCVNREESGVVERKGWKSEEFDIKSISFHNKLIVVEK